MAKGCRLDWKSTNSVEISGEIDEYADFSGLSRSMGQILYVDFARVTRLNSSGLKLWLQSITKNKIQLVLRECSVAVVEQFFMIPQFMGKNGVVESFYASYSCVSCEHEEQMRYQIGQNIDLRSPQIGSELKDPCPECGASMELDQSQDMYLSFFQTHSPAAS
ncbi:MAG: hypothetical protein EOP04_26150 [Proteobacteria bacterium]|nr:MAG: hypothetical protein EOP04_26150 [Pseudomonadota bacterium]